MNYVTSIEKIINIQVSTNGVIIDGRNISFVWKDVPVAGTNQEIAETMLKEVKVAGANIGTFTGYKKSDNALQVFLYDMAYFHWINMGMWWWKANGVGFDTCNWGYKCIEVQYIDVIVDIDTFRVIDTSLNIGYRNGAYKYNFVQKSKIL